MILNKKNHFKPKDKSNTKDELISLTKQPEPEGIWVEANGKNGKNGERKFYSAKDFQEKFGKRLTNNFWVDKEYSYPKSFQESLQSVFYKFPKLNNQDLYLVDQGEFGWGVVTNRLIKKDEIVCWYSGAIESSKKNAKYGTEINSELCVNAEQLGNISCYIQHATTKDNLQKTVVPIGIKLEQIATQNVQATYGDKNNAVTYFKAIEDIPKGNMLFSNYGLSYWKRCEETETYFDKQGKPVAKDKYRLSESSIVIQYSEEKSKYMPFHRKDILELISKSDWITLLINKSKIISLILSKLMVARIATMSSVIVPEQEAGISILNYVCGIKIQGINEHIKEAKKAIETKDSEACLFNAAVICDLYLTSELFKNKIVNINSKNAHGQTALTVAINSKAEPKVKKIFVTYLLACGASAFIKDNSGKTAYDYANTSYKAIIESAIYPIISDGKSETKSKYAVMPGDGYEEWKKEQEQKNIKIENNSNIQFLGEEKNPVALYNKGFQEFKNNEFTNAIVFYQKALDQFKNSKDTEKRQINCLHSLGLCCKNSDEHDEAIVHFQRAIEMKLKFDPESDPANLVKQYIECLKNAKKFVGNSDDLAKKLFVAKKYSSALDIFLVLLDDYKDNNQIALQVICCSSIASCYRELKNYDSAKQYCKEALDMYNKNIKACFTIKPIEIEKIETKLKNIGEMEIQDNNKIDPSPFK